MKVKISTLSFQNSTRHLTGVIKIITLKLKNVIKRYDCFQVSFNTLFCHNNHRRVTALEGDPQLSFAKMGEDKGRQDPSVVINTTLFIILIGITVTATLFSTPTSALTYQDFVDVSFTFAPTLSISLSSSNISIDSLSPGNYAHSNTVAINVSTNNVYGYTLTAKVGDDGGASGASASSNLVNASTSTSFTSLSTNDNLTLSSFSPNTWGYTTSSNINNSTTTYSGLLYNTDTTLNVTRNARGTASSSYPGTNTTNFTIGASAGTGQLAGDYTNTITFTAVTNNVRPVLTLYDLVADMSKGKNTDSSSHFSWTSITKPTSTDPATDTSSSGVFEWDGKTAGHGVDSNGGDSKIYFYRGILDTTLTNYGSDGLADAYPNYIKLDNDTCWRIVRTTSTGGVKMIYNGNWTGSTCANATTRAQLTTSPFNNGSATVAGKTYYGLQYQNIQAVGYTYTSSVAPGTTDAKTPAELFGTSWDDTTTNDKSSIIKQYIEDWYSANMTTYTSILEGDAGYCQDRRLNASATWTTPLAEDSNTIIPYGTSDMPQYYFGAYPRNMQGSTFNPLLTCSRGKVDLYSYSGGVGNGNGQLAYPVALLIADEVSLAGSGYNKSFNAYNANSFLVSGRDFWLLSPDGRNSVGAAIGLYLGPSGGFYYSAMSNNYGVRPAISLKPDITPTAGSGTATDPWLISAP